MLVTELVLIVEVVVIGILLIEVVAIIFFVGDHGSVISV